MPEFPFVSGGAVRTVGATAGTSSRSTTMTTSASADTKGTVVQVTAATEFDANWMLIQFPRGANGTVNLLADILIGAATEQVIIPNLYVFARNANGGGPTYLFPIFVPKGSRISARCQSSAGSSTFDVAVTLISGTMIGGGAPPSFVSAYGAVTASVGTLVDPTGLANVDSAWTEIVAATDRAHNWLAIAVRPGDGTITTATEWRLSIGIDAATEATLIPDIHLAADTTLDFPATFVYCLPVCIPSGSRLTARVRSTVTTAGDRSVNVKLYGAG